MFTILRSAVLATGLVAIVQPAAAAVMSTQLTVLAGGFANVSGGDPVPVDPYTLSFRVTFDPVPNDQFDNATGIVLAGASRQVTGGLVFDYDRSLDQLTVGGASLGAGGLSEQTDDVFAIVDHPFAPVPMLEQFDYTSGASAGIYETFTGSVSVPEPASAAILLAGLALAGRGRRRV